jgi:hypothetical protein
MPIASGSDWVAKFPTKADAASCVSPFRERLEAFIAALKVAGATVSINATLRPPERAYLMRTAWDIAHGDVDPTDAQPMAGVDIDWVARNPDGTPDLEQSQDNAQAMVDGYEIAFQPSLTSLHITGQAVDMDISWTGVLQIATRDGVSHAIGSLPRSGTNPDLARVGASYGVFKLVSDPPHWSINGH